MHKIKLILLLILPLSVLGQDLGIIDTRTTKNPALNGTYRISTDGKNLFFRNFIGLSKKVANTDSATFTGLITLPATTSIGSVSSTELSYLDGVTSSIQTQLGNKQAQLNGTGFVKASGTTISYDNSTYLTTSSASSTYLPLAGGTLTGNLTLNNGGKFVGQVGTYYNGNQVIVDFFGTTYGRIQSYNAVGSFGMPLVLQGSGGNVGIGTVPTLRRLEVSDAIRSISNFAGFESIHAISGTSYRWILNNDDKYYLQSSSDKFVANSSTRLLIDNSGNVGIGTTSPSEKLNVSGNILATGTVLGSNLSGTNTGDDATNTQYSGLATSKQDALSGTGFVKASGTTISYDNSTYLTTSTAASTYLPISNPTTTGTLTAPTITNTLGANFATSSGNVGIGTTSPSSKLHISGSGDNKLKIASTATNNPYLNLTLQNTGSTPIGVLEAGDGVAYRALALNPTSGNVMIGTSSNAGYKLDVNGTFNANSIYTKDNQSGYAGNYGRYSVAYPYATFTTSGAWGYDWQVNGTSKMTMSSSGNVGIGATPGAQSLQVYSSTNDIAFQAINGKTTGTNYAVAGTASGAGGTLNMGGFFYADGATTNHGIRVFNVTAAANNYALFIDSPAKSYFQGSVGVGTTTPAASSILDITSTTKGILFPRMTTTEINAITSPADGLTVYNTTLKVICFYDSSAAAWRKVSHSAM